MGGTISAVGNTRNLTAEFNIYCDPEAALITLDAFPQSMMVSWETTLKHTFPWPDYDALAATPTTAGRFFRDTTHTGTTYIRGLRAEFGYLLPDPLAMAVALQPDLILNQRPALRLRRVGWFADARPDRGRSPGVERARAECGHHHGDRCARRLSFVRTDVGLWGEYHAR